MDYITTGVSKTPEQAGIQLTTETFTVPKTKNDIKPIEEETSEKIESAPVVEDKKAETIESAPVVEDKKPEITEPDTHDTKDKSLKSFLGRIKKAVVPEIDEDAFEHENTINASTKPIDNTPKPVIAPAKLVEKPQPIVAPVEPVEKPQPTANPAEPVKKAPSAPIKETTTESDISSRYEKLFGKNDLSSENSESLDKTESRFEKLFGVKNSTENNESSDNKQTNANNEPKDGSVVFEKPIQNDEENVHNRTPQSTIPALKTESRFEKLFGKNDPESLSQSQTKAQQTTDEINNSEKK